MRCTVSALDAVFCWVEPLGLWGALCSGCMVCLALRLIDVLRVLHCITVCYIYCGVSSGSGLL